MYAYYKMEYALVMTHILVGTIVKAKLKGDKKICIITKEYIKGNGTQGYQVRPLNGIQHSAVDGIEIEIIPPDPSDIPHSSNDLDPDVVQRCLTEEDLHKLWNCTIDNTVSKENRVTLY